MVGGVLRGGYDTTLSSLFLVPTQAHLQDMYYDGTHSSSPSSSSSFIIIIRLPPGIFYHHHIPSEPTTERPTETTANTLAWLPNLHLLPMLGFLSLFSIDKQRRHEQYHAGRGDLSACRCIYFYLWCGVVWWGGVCLLGLLV